MVNVKEISKINGNSVDLITLSEDDFSVEIFSLGATIRSIKMKDKNGDLTDVCLGYDTPEEYLEKSGCLGACIGRYANRIENAQVVINNVKFNLTKNEGENQLHGGFEGFHRKNWSYEVTENSVTFSTFSYDLEEGFPGNLAVKTTYILENKKLIIKYWAKADKDTIVNLTNHTYFNLSGHNSGNIDDHYLSMRASFFTPTKEGSIPTGEIFSVKNTIYELEELTRVGDKIYGKEGSFDHNLILDNISSTKSAATLFSPKTGIKMETYTTKPAIQLYCASALGDQDGKDGAKYHSFSGICLETQFYPNSPNVKHFSSPFLLVGEQYNHQTVYEFSVEK